MTPKPLFTLPVEDDPLPWLTQQFREAGAFAEEPVLNLRHRRTPTLRAMSAALGITSSIVTALSDHPKRFSVRFSPTKATASTNAKTREVVIGIKPMLDPRLTDGQRAALMVALANHEVGHVIWTVDMFTRFTKEFGADNKPAFKVFNIAHDVLLETMNAKAYPGYAPTFHVKCAYWGRLWKVRLNSKRNRMGALTQATLYPQGSDWTLTPEVAEWFAWATDWAERCRSKKAGTYPYLFALVREALERLRLDEMDEPEPEEEVEEAPDPDDEPEEPEDEFSNDYDEDGDSADEVEDEGDDGLSDPQPEPEEDEDFDEPEPYVTPEPEDDEPEDEPEESEDEESDDAEDEPEDPEPEDEPDADEPEDPEESEDEDPVDDDTSDDDEDWESVPEEADDESEDDDGDEDESEDDESDDDESEDDDTSEDEDSDSEGDWDDSDHEDGESKDDGDESEDDGDDSEDEGEEPEFDDENDDTPEAHHAQSDEGESWQSAIDDYERLQVTGKDKVIVGGGSFNKREVRIIRIQR